jgi:CcmD family protein
MNPTLKEIYSAVLEQWPLVAAAYAILWTTLVAYIAFALRRLNRLGKQVEVLEAAVERRVGSASSAGSAE